MTKKLRKIKSRKSNVNITRRNHFVPQWYQCRFMKEGQTRYWCLDKGKKTDNLYYDIPKSFFQQKHLYTIDLFGKKNDDIEKRLFGDIDARGSKAIDIIAKKDGWNIKGGHQQWKDFMEYMNAQKVRTPKGLDWLKHQLFEISGYNLAVLDKRIVLNHMNTTRQMYCTMWTEAIWEIVSACNSEVKFVVSDNPVTFYNLKIGAGPHGDRYTDEPSLLMIGTQTIYPLSLNYCLILTHRQMALNPETVDPCQSRINARYYDHANSRAILSFQDIIHERVLTDNDVCVFNYVLKQQAKRYIASARKEWLFPEKHIENDSWHEFHKLFLPPRDNLHISTAIFMWYKDGSIDAFDPFGQRITDPKEIERFKKNKIMIKKLTRKEKFSEELTELLNKYDTPNIEEQNELLINGITDIFEMTNSNIESFKDNFTVEKVRQLYLLIEDLWPVGTDIFNMLLPEDGFNLIYSGEVNFQTIPLTLLSLGLYFDKVYITNPFHHPCCMRDSYNPLIIPEQYLTTTYNTLLAIISLFPWVETGQVQILPNPFALDFSFRKIAIDNIEERKKELNPQYDKDFCRNYLRQLEQILFMTPDNALEYTIKNLIPMIPEDLIEGFAKDIRARKNDPLFWTKSFEEIGPQLLADKICENLETVIYLAQLTNSVPYTYLKLKKDEIEGINALSTNSKEYEVKLLNCSDGLLIKALKDAGVLESVRVVLRKLKNQPRCKELHAELEEAISESEKDWNPINDALKKISRNRYTILDTKILFNTGKFNLPPIQNHLQNTYSNNILSDVRMYLSSGELKAGN